MRFIKTAVILFFGCLIALSACTTEDNVEIAIMKVNHYKQSGAAEARSQFLLVQEKGGIGGGDWNIFYDDIEGFKYQLGYLYTLKVEKENIENPPADGGSIRYKLIKEISKEKAPSEVSFQILLSRFYDGGGFESFFKKTDNSTFQLIDGTKIDCGILCNELAEKLTAKEGITGVFKHSNDNELLLIDLK